MQIVKASMVVFENGLPMTKYNLAVYSKGCRCEEARRSNLLIMGDCRPTLAMTTCLSFSPLEFLKFYYSQRR